MYSTGDFSVFPSDLKSILSSIHIFLPRRLTPSPERHSTLLRHCKLSSLARGPPLGPFMQSSGTSAYHLISGRGPFSRAPPHSQSEFLKWKGACLADKDLIIYCSFWKKPSHDIQSLWGSGNPLPFPCPVPLACRVYSGYLCSMFLAVLHNPTAWNDCSTETRTAFSSSLSEWGQGMMSHLSLSFLKLLFYVSFYFSTLQRWQNIGAQ